jgi:hypothetical protein
LLQVAGSAARLPCDNRLFTLVWDVPATVPSGPCSNEIDMPPTNENVVEHTKPPSGPGVKVLQMNSPLNGPT